MNIYQIEITNNCNFRCTYCPRQYMKRSLGVMSENNIKKIADIAEPNSIIRLHHYGESLIYLYRTIFAIKTLKTKGIKTILNTNGSLLCNSSMGQLVEAGIDKVFLSYHNEKSINNLDNISKEYRSKITILKIADEKELSKYIDELNTFKEKGYTVELKKLRDLGQISKNDKGSNSCSYIKNNEVVVLWDGTIVPCCECFDNDYILGHIEKDNQVLNKSFKYCITCKGYGNDEYETERISI